MYRLIYKSRCTEKLDREMVRGILHESMEQNRESGLTGALIATDTHFLQILEGGFRELNETFFRIFKDGRHTDIQLISFASGASRLFEGWAMRGLGVFDLNRELENELKSKYGEEDGSVCFPLEEWAALSIVNDVHMMSRRSCTDEG